MNLLNKFYDLFPSFSETTMSDLYFNEESDVIILRKIQVTIKAFTLPFFNHISLSLNRKKLVLMRAMRKKLNLFTLQLLINNILE